MIGKTISHYKILEKLCEGDRDVIYKAEDTKLRRTVALKFLAGGLTRDPAAKRHFIHQVQAASVLDHVNICTVYEVDEFEGDAFIAMAYIDGRSLQTKIESGQLGLDEAVAIAIQIAVGVHVAHEKGIVHHDIKPNNIMVTSSGQVKILDFGLANMPGLAVAPPTYMSPEQVREEEVDHRTDIWSLAVVLYEMVAGHPPFEGAYSEAIAYSILNDDPKSLASIQSGGPAVLEGIVQKALAKNPSDRYQSMNELLIELQLVAGDVESAGAGGQSSTTVDQPSIGVLPFANTSGDSEQEYFCDGITEDISNYLARVEGLRVAAITSAFAFKGKHGDIRSIGRKLGVETLLEGSVRKAGDRLRISAQLVNVADGYHVWSERYDRKLKDVFAIQDGIAQQIVTALKVELTDRDRYAMTKSRTRDVHAYDFYLRGRRFLYLAQRRSFGFAQDMFSQAIGKDPGYALAYAGIADSYSFRFMYCDSDQAHLQESLRASQKALELNPDLAEAHASRGLALSLSRHFNEANAAFETAIRLNAVLFEAYYFYGRNCYAQGKVEKASRMFEQARRVSFEDYQLPFFLALTYRDLDREAEAETEVRRGLALVKRHLELNPDDARAYVLGASGFAELEEKERALEWARRALSIDPDNPITYYVVACCYARLGLIEDAIDCIEKAISAGPIYTNWLERDSDLDPIRGHPRFRSLLEKMQ